MDLIHDFIGSALELSNAEFVFLCFVSFLTSAISASFGLGGGAMLVTIMASLLNPIAIIPVHAVVQVSSNFFRTLMMWRYIKFTFMLPFVIGSLIGVLIGGTVVFALPSYLLQGTIGLFILYTLWGPATKALDISSKTFIGVGMVSSFATMFVGGTGPLVAPFVRAVTEERRMTVSTHAAFMSFQHGVKILVFGILGFVFTPYIPLITGMIILGILGTWLGKNILTLMPERVFRIAFNSVLTLLALRLIYEAFRRVLGS
jgi:uncharacterized membrane protein YfcA